MSDYNIDRAKELYDQILGNKQEYNTSIRLFVTDMEGTVFESIPSHIDRNVVAPSLWAVLMHNLGTDAFTLESYLQDSWRDQGFKQYGRFVRQTVEVMQHYGLTKDDFDTAIHGYAFNPGCEDAFKRIHEAGIYTGMISGGFQEQVELAQRTLSLDSATGACKLFFNEEGVLEGCNSLPWDHFQKERFIESLSTELDARPSEIAYIGDSGSDIPIMEKVGLPILLYEQASADEKRRAKMDPIAKKVQGMEHGVVVEHWDEVPGILRDYNRKRVY